MNVILSTRPGSFSGASREIRFDGWRVKLCSADWLDGLDAAELAKKTGLVGLAIQFGVCEFACVIFVFGHFSVLLQMRRRATKRPTPLATT